MRRAVLFLLFMSLLAAQTVVAQPYDFSAADKLLTTELPNLNGHAAVIVRQNGVEVFRHQTGDIDFDTTTRLASVTKTVSAGVILSLVDDGLLTLTEPLGDTLQSFDRPGIGDATVLDSFAMRHGINTRIAYEHRRRFTLARSVDKIGKTGKLVHRPGAKLRYDGAGMQATGRIAELRTKSSWATIARERILDRCGMPKAVYKQFKRNPAIAGGLRSSADEMINFAQMLIDRGFFDGERVLSDESIEHFFTNETRGLPVMYSPWPKTHPLYPYGADPDYAFGVWVLAENPQTKHVEEIVGAGAWGSFLWVDRRRGMTAVLITDIRAGTLSSMDAALGLFEIARQQADANQIARLTTTTADDEGVLLSWAPAKGSISTRIYGSSTPIRDVFDLRSATLLAEVSEDRATVPGHRHYAATSVFETLENTALTPGGNSIEWRP